VNADPDLPPATEEPVGQAEQADPPDPPDSERARVDAFLARRFGADAERAIRLGRGEWSTAWAFRLGGADLVIRFGPSAEDFAKDRLAARFAAPGLPIPAVMEIGEAFGGFYAVSERVHGWFLDDLDEAGMRATLPALFAMLDAARAADLSGTTGFGAWGADGHAPHASWRAALLDIAEDRPTDRTPGWRDRLRASPTGAGPFAEAFAILRVLADRVPDERCLIHGDLLNVNVLVAGDPVAGSRIAGVIDWGCAMAGDFLYDQAWLLFWQPWYPAWAAIDIRGAAERHYAALGLHVPDLAARLRCCQIHIGLASQAYNAWKGRERWPNLERVARRTAAVARGEA
jgi:hygromycin-B 4-O-kinase